MAVTKMSAEKKKTRKEKQAEFRQTIQGARKRIREFIIMMVGVYIGFQVMISFFNFDVSMVALGISAALAIVIIAALMYTVYQIKLAKALIS